MTLDVQLLLPPDVELVPVRDLTRDIRRKIDASDDDYSLTRRRFRAPSCIIDNDSAALLSLFRSPTRVVDAVLSFAGERGLDPELTLEEAYPLLSRLYDGKVLVPANSADANPVNSKLRIGGVVAGFRLLRCIQILADTEVFVGRDSVGRYAAVKFCPHRDSRAGQALEREASILRMVENRRAPAVLVLRPWDEGLALITEWVFGLNAADTAMGMRGRREPRTEKGLLQLCVEITRAFADLHASGVLHGDVHPGNILVEPSGAVRLIDFGLSQEIDAATARLVARGGVPFYFDPELASAQRSHRDAPLTTAGEQYSVAALLFELWTGVPYVEWRLERGEILRQIVEEPPATFDARRVSPWPDLEQLLRRGLEKRPERRFRSMSTFERALRRLLPASEARDKAADRRRGARAREQELLERSLSRYSLGGSGLREGPRNAPFASVNYGAGGIAYGVYRIAQRRGNPRLLALADVWTQKAYAVSSHEQAFYHPELGIEREVVGEISLFHSISGLHCVRGLVSISLGDVESATHAIRAFVASSRRPCVNPDLTLGTAGLLIGLAEIVESLPTPWLIDVEPARSRGHEISTELLKRLDSDSISGSTSLPSLGVAHGWGGLLFALLRWANATTTDVDGIVIEKLHELGSLAEPHGGGVRWPVHNATRAPSYMDGWCNGTAGHVLLFALAHEVLKLDSFAELTERGAESAWATEAQIGTLCCGLAGVCYALLAAHRVTGSEVWLTRARALSRRAAADVSGHFFLDSLYKGALGVAVLAEDLKHPTAAAMPLFEPTS